ncbi:MAG: betaine/proline/choline family ABC transporter ATP-binding protein [Acidimicrobiales bacterium]|nr:betaine/proline/choline family ABC transporter ATP-binding protein [Acidimicrobiales bacterium]
MVDTRISFQSVTKIFGSDPEGPAAKMLGQGVSKAEIQESTDHIVALDDVTFDVREGETFVVMGLSGSGKSTLIRTVNRLVEPSWGHVYVDGDDVIAMSQKELQQVRGTKLGMVFQHFALFPHRTVRENVAYPLRLQGVDSDDWHRAADQALELVGLEGWGDYMPDNLSGGMQQRVGLARALAADPPILLLDEAFSALDPLIRRQMQNELLTIQESLHKTILFITHDLNEALRVGDRVCIMRDGEVVQIGTPEEIVTEPSEQYVADFIRDVDQARVLGVEFVATEAITIPVDATTVDQAYDTVDESELDAAYVVDANQSVVGLVTRDDLERARAVGSRDLASVVRKDYPETTSDATISELYALCGRGLPVAVVDESTGSLTGVVDPLNVLAKLGLIENIGDQEPQLAGDVAATDAAGEAAS